jgi:TP901 family phage tail tape measure protein
MLKVSPIKVLITGEDKLSKKMDKVQRRIQAFATVTNKIGRGLTAGITMPLAAVGAVGLKAANDLNKGFANISTLIPGQTERLKGLRSETMKLSAETGQSFEDLTKGLYDTVSAFGDTEETMGRLTVASKAAKAGVSTVEDSLSLLSAVTKGYGDTSEKATQKAADLAFMTVKLGQTTFPELSQSIGKVVPLAAALKTEQTELFGAMATLTGVTGDAAEVSTQLSSVYSAVLKPSGKMTKMAKELGYESAAAMLKQEGLGKSLLKIGAASSGLKKVEKGVKKLGFASLDAMINQLGFAKANEKIQSISKRDDSVLAKALKRKEALVAVLALLGGQSENFAEKTRKMEDAVESETSTMLEAYREQTEGINKVGHSFEQTRQRMMGLAVRIGDRLLPIAERFMNMIEPWVRRFEKMDSATLDLTLKLAGFAAAAGPILLIVSNMATKAGTMLQVFGSLGPSATDAAGGLSEIGGATAGITGAKNATLGLGSAVGALGALLAGYAIGTALYKGVIEPFNEFKREKAKLAKHGALKSEEALKVSTKSKTIKGTDAAIKANKKAQADLAQSFGGLENAVNLVGSAVTGRRSNLEEKRDVSLRLRNTRRELELNKKEFELEKTTRKLGYELYELPQQTMEATQADQGTRLVNTLAKLADAIAQDRDKPITVKIEKDSAKTTETVHRDRGPIMGWR